MSRTCAAVLVSLLAAAPAWGQSIGTAPLTTGATATATASAAATAATTAPPAPAAEAPPMPTVGSLFTDLKHDVKHLASIESAVILGLGGALGAGAHHNDPFIAASAATSESFDEAFDAGTYIGSGWVQIGGAFTLYVIGRGNGYHNLAVTGADLVRAQILNTGITIGVKTAVDRTRPDGRKYSFPSGHTSSAFATAAVLERHYGWKAGLPAYAAAAYVGGSRIAENKHFLSDVAFGAAVGILAGRTVTVGSGDKRFALTPIAAPGGGGVRGGLQGARGRDLRHRSPHHPGALPGLLAEAVAPGSRA